MRRSWRGALAIAGFFACAGTAYADAPTIQVLSNRADLVSGGEALVDVSLPTGTDAGSVKVTVGGQDETSAFAMRPNGKFEGLVTGLANGPNTVSASTPAGTAQITITNHPIGGPVIAGPQVQPWICGTTLGPAQDAQCDAPTQYSYMYKSTSGSFKPYDRANPPSDVATTTTDQGTTVPYIVRVENGVADREYYAVAVLYNPAQPWTPWQPQAGWNQKLVVPFGGDCKPWHQQSAPSSVLDDQALSRGFAVANSGANVLGSDCNSVVSAEALMMLKEHLVDAYGPIRYTIGEGCSGGSMQQMWDAANYPGLLNGILPSCSFSDIWITMQEAEDCHLLDNYYDHTSSQLWQNAADRVAVDGYVDEVACRGAWESYAKTWFDPSNASGCSTIKLPPPGVYNPLTNPGGVRCTLQDYGVNIWGQRSDGFANRPYDNVGVQYGLQALLAGKISAAQFVDLNQKIGGLSIDFDYTTQRSVADPEALTVAYRTGQVTFPRESAKVPIIDLRGTANSDIHSDHHSYVFRARLDQANGGHGNQVIYTSAGGTSGASAATNQGFLAMDSWLSNIESDSRSVSLQQKVLDGKPAAAVDTCWIGTRAVTDPSTCRTQYPYYADPRLVAGAPMTDNSMKCQLKPLNRADYPPNTFTDAQWATMQSTFPSGVCDWNQAPVGFQPSIPWLTYAGAQGGEPLPAAPVSEAVSMSTTGPVAGTVPATLSLTLGTSASFGSFVPGVTQDYSASTTANIISTAGDALLSVSDPSATATGHLVNGSFSLPSPLQARARNAANTGTAFSTVGSSASPLKLLTWTGPISNDAVSLDFMQHIASSDALRTGAYSKVLTFTLSTTSP